MLGRGARWAVASRAVSVRRGSITHTCPRRAISRTVPVGLGIEIACPCETTGLTPTSIRKSALSRSVRPDSPMNPPTRSETRGLAVPSMVRGLNLAGVPIAACSASAMRKPALSMVEK